MLKTLDTVKNVKKELLFTVLLCNGDGLRSICFWKLWKNGNRFGSIFSERIFLSFFKQCFFSFAVCFGGVSFQTFSLFRLINLKASVHLRPMQIIIIFFATNGKSSCCVSSCDIPSTFIYSKSIHFSFLFLPFALVISKMVRNMKFNLNTDRIRRRVVYISMCVCLNGEQKFIHPQFLLFFSLICVDSHVLINHAAYDGQLTHTYKHSVLHLIRSKNKN